MIPKLTVEAVEEAIETIQNLLNAECLVLSEMPEEEKDRRVAKALTLAYAALKELRKDIR